MAKEKDFDKADSGTYKPNPHRQTIIDSLAKIKYQSSRHLCMDTGVSIGDVLAVVEAEGDKDIALKFVGGVMVYYLRENEPDGTLYNTGENSFAVRSKDGRANNKPPRVKESRVTAEAVERYAFEGLSVEEASAGLGVSAATFKNYLYSGKKPEIKNAWQHGKIRREEMIASAKVELSPKPEKAMNRDHYEFNDKNIHKECGYVLDSAGCADAHGINHSTIPVTDAEDEAFEEIANRQNLSDEDLVEMLVMSDERFEQNFSDEPEELLEVPKTNGHVIQHGSRLNHPVVKALLKTPPLPEIITVDFNNQVESVNHPRHYNTHPSGVECIDVVEHFNFNLGNAIKYLWRADEKGSALEDLEKAAWYIQREIEKRNRFGVRQFESVGK